jgi:MtaA/CmuA family methyltransferase
MKTINTAKQMTSKQRCLAAIKGLSVDKTPVFPLLMFLSADRLGISYKEFSTNGNAMAQAQIKAYETFGIDAITACSDAFRISADLAPEKMVYPQNQPPHLSGPIVKTKSDLDRLVKIDVTDSKGRTYDRAKGVREMVRAVGEECLVLGWVDMPFAEACSVCGITEFMMMMYEDPVLAHQVLEFLTDIVIDFAVYQIEMGVPMIGAGDAAASLVAPAMFREFALPYEQRVCRAVHDARGLVKLHICGNTSNLLEDMVHSGADLFNVDHLVDFEKACRIYGKANKCFKGNLDPVTDFLNVSPKQCQQTAIDRIARAKNTKYMLSAGCEVPIGVSDEVFAAFCNAPSCI